MRRSVLLVLTACFALLNTAGPAFAQDVPRTPEDMATPDNRQARLQRLRKRLASMTPEQREAFKKRLDEFKNSSPERKAELRRRMKELKKRGPAERKRLRRLNSQLQKTDQRERFDRQQDRFSKLPQEQRQQYHALVRKVIRGLPKDQRRELAQLDPSERRHKIRSLLREHRHGLLDRKLDKLPADVRRNAGRNLEGLQGRARFRQGREMIDGYVRRQAQAIHRNPNLSPEQKMRKMRKLINRHVPKGPRRDAMLRKMKERAARLQRARKQRGQRPGVDRPGRRPTDRPGQRRRPPQERNERAPRRRTRRDAPQR